MKNIVFCLIILLSEFSITLCNVLELDEDFLNVEKDGKWLVMFYAPWCGHCRNLEPTWNEVGSSFQNMQSDIQVARLDASKYTSVASYFSIRGFPTIKFFKDGHRYDYNGARDKYSIISFVDRANGPSVTALSDSKSLDQVKEKSDIYFLYVGENAGTLFDMYLSITKELFTTISFYHAPRKILPKDVTVRSEPTILVYKDQKFYELPDDLPDAEFLKLWITSEQFASYNELTGMTYHLLRDAGRRFAIAVLKKDDPLNKTFETMAYARSHPYMFLWVKGNGIVNRMTSGEVAVPNIVVYDPNTFEYFIMLNENDSQPLSKKNVEEFFQKIKDGDIAPQGGASLIQRFQRSVMDVMIFFYELFAKKPIVASIIVVVPIVLFVALCACLCSPSDEGVIYIKRDRSEQEKTDKKAGIDDEEFEHLEDDEAAGDREDDGAAGDHEDDEDNTNLRKRIKEQKDDN